MDKGRFAGACSTRVVVFGQGFAIIIWPSESGDQALCNSLGFCKRLSNTLFRGEVRVVK
jgi:hypothetical protein